MFDARSILEGIVRGAGPSANSGQGGGDAGGLGNILQELQRQLGGAANQGNAGQGTSGGGLGGLGDILGKIQEQMNSANQPTPGARNVTEAPSGNAGGLGGLGDILGKIQEQMGSAASGAGAGAGSNTGAGGGLMDVLGKVLSQATQGVREGAAQVGDATGARDALGRATGGRSANDILGQLSEFIQKNPLAAGTAAAGLGGLVLGTNTGRSVAGSAARLGALAMIGGLAYKAVQNYQAGKPLITGATPAEAAPSGSGFEAAAATNDQAIHYIQAMIAAAAADGRISADEQSRIIASLGPAGVGAEAEQFLANELNNPATPEQLARAVSSPEEAVQLYTAARIAIEPDTGAEQQFLAALAAALGLDPKLAAHIDATARGAVA